MRSALLSIASVMFCARPTAAQLSRGLDRCPPYPALADKISDTHREAASPPTVVIDEVKFDGPIHLRDSIRKQLVARLKASRFDANSRWLDEVQVAWIRGAWQDEGFLKVNPTARAQIIGSDSTVQHVLLSVHVDEGLQYSLGSVRFRSADPDDPLVFSVEKLRGLIPMRDGDIFSAEKIRRALDAMKQLYGSNGYIDFVVTPITDIADDHPRISLTIEIGQQEQFRFGKIEVFSSNPAIEPLLRSKLHAGDVFNSQLIQSFLTENKTSLPPDVSLADVEVHRNVRTGTADLRFNLEPCP